MAKTDDGEFELTLGNRQLLSVFFLVVILFAVVFTMGYIVGRNSLVNAGAAAAQKAPEAAPQRTEPKAVPPVTAQPAANTAETAPAAEAPKPTPDPPAAPPPETAKPAAIVEPVAGQAYLQVAAVRQREAEVIAESLRNKGFAAILGPGPNELVRVLVGPMKDSETLARTKTELEAAGFKNPIVRK